MIYCVKFAAVEAHLSDLGYEHISETPETLIFRHRSRPSDLINVHRPNVDGNLPEALINGALNRKNLPLPTWDVFWCD